MGRCSIMDLSRTSLRAGACSTLEIGQKYKKSEGFEESNYSTMGTILDRQACFGHEFA
jgi:hypothetical protein